MNQTVDIWAACKDAVHPTALEGVLIRVVESQEQIATNALVDTLEEQALLEELLEASKPPLPPAAEGLHYLLATPFRYPPLKHGSRFGTRLEPSLFYGSLTLGSVLAETAYYRLLFWSGMAQPPVSRRLTTEHTAFGAAYLATRGVRLQRPPFAAFAPQLLDPQSYTATQQLGHNLREAAIEAFEYQSARDPQRGINIALFTPTVFTQPKPLWQQTWLCDTRAEEVAFFSKEAGAVSFRREQFLVDGELPSPAL